MALQIRRGTNSQRLGITLVEGEVVYVTDFELTTVTGTSISSNVITTSVNHGLSVGNRVRYLGPTGNGLTANTVYYIIADGLTANTFKLSLTAGGAAVVFNNLTGVSIILSIGPQDIAGDPLPNSVAPVWVGDGVTVGGNAAGASLLDELSDVTIGVSGVSGVPLADRQLLNYDQASNQWRNVSDVIVPGTLQVNSTSDLAGAYIDNVQIGITTDNTIDTVSGDLVIDAATNIVQIQSTLNVDSGTMVVRADTNRVGILNSSPTYPLDVTGIARATGGVNGSNLQMGITGSTTIDSLTGNITINSAGGTTVVDDNLTVSGDLRLMNNTITSSTGNTPIVLNDFSATVQGSLTVQGDLTVNGSTTTVNSTTLTVDDKNIELAATTSPNDSTATGGGITLKGTTDKRIIWQLSNNRWSFDNGDGVVRPMVIELNDLNNVQTTSFSDGEFLVAVDTSTNPRFINTSLVEFTNINARPKFIANAGGSLVAAEFLKRVATAADGDTSGIFFGSIDSISNAKLYSQRVTSEYDTAGNNILRIQTDSANNFAPGSTTVKTQFYVDDVSVAANANQLILNANHTGAPAQDVSIKVERGSETDATLTWNETNNFWSFNTAAYSNAGFIGEEYLATNGNEIYFNFDDVGGATSSIVVKRGANADVAFRWNETTDRWESTTDGSSYIQLPNQSLDTGNSPIFAGATLGNVQVGVSTDNEIDTTTGNLTIDSAGGTTTIDDAVVVSGNLTHNGATATFNNNVTLGNSVADEIRINGSLQTDLIFADQTATPIGVRGTLGGNDNWFVGGYAASSDTGEMIIATADNGMEPIYVRQYSGNILSGTVTNEITLLNSSGNTVFPGTLQVRDGLTVTGNGYIYSGTDLVLTLSGNDVFMAGDATIAGNLTHNGATATFNNGLSANNVRVATTNDNTITTSTGDLTIDSATGVVKVDGSLDVLSNIEATGGLTLDGAASSITIGGTGFGQFRTAAIQTTTTTSTATTDLVGAGFATTAYRSMEFTLQATRGTEYQIVKGVAIHDGTNTWINTYSDIKTGSSDLFTVNATIAGGSFKLQVTSTSATSTTYKGSWTAIVV